jgi:hypothetical protein
MLLMPCNQCRRSADCESREQKRAILRGTNLTVARFTCPILKDDYRSGRRVRVLLLCESYEDSVNAAFLGTVMQWVGRKLLIHLDTGESQDGYEARKPIIKSWPHWVEPFDEPDRRPCEVCHLPPGAVIDGWHCGCQPGQFFA